MDEADQGSSDQGSSDQGASDRGPNASPGAGGLQIDHVYLEGATPDGQAVVGQLSVVVDEGGITVLGPAPGARRLLAWGRLSSFTTGAAATLPDGAAANALEFVLDGRPLRLLLPTALVPGGPNLADHIAAYRSVGNGDKGANGAANGAGEASGANGAAEARAENALAAADGAPPVDRTTPGSARTGHGASDTSFEEPVSATRASGATAVAVAPERVVPVADEDAGASVEEAEARPEERFAGTPRMSARLAVQQRPKPWRRVLVVVGVVVLAAVAAGLWYTRGRASSPLVLPGASKDAALAATVGIRTGDLTGWVSRGSATGNPFAAGAGQSDAALRTAQQATAVLARCLRVPVSDVNGAFGLGSVPPPSGHADSGVFADPSGGSSTASSSVDVMRSVRDEQNDFRVFENPNLFATCYQPYAQAMLPYTVSPGTGSSGLSFATVEPVVVPPPPDGSATQVAAFQIARIANDKGQTVTMITTAIAVYGGRLQATLGTVSDFVFPLDAQNTFVHSIEARVIGASLL